MTQVCCPRCRLRFPGAMAVSLTACPHCREPVQRLARADQVLGFQLHSAGHLLPDASSHRLPDALIRAVAAAKRARDKAPS